MSLYHSVTVNSEDLLFEPVIVEVNNIDWKNAYYRRERKKKIIIFLLSLLIVSGCVAVFLTNKHQLNLDADSRKVIRSHPYFHRKRLSQSAPSASSNITSPSCTNTRVVAYYPGNGRRTMPPSQLEKLTHVVFSHLVLNSNGSISFRNDYEENKFLELKNYVATRNSKVKLIISIEEGGANFEFSKVSADARKRKTFFESVSSFILKHDLDGVDLNWEYPEQKDLPNQVKLVKELREYFNRIAKENKTLEPYIISIVIPALGHTDKNEIGENLPNLLEYIDFVNIMSIDYSNFYKNHTGPSAPLYSTSGRMPCVNHTISYYIKKTGNSKKLNLGLAFHGTYWNNVIGKSSDIWKTVEMPKGYMERGQVAFRNIEKEGWPKSMSLWDQESKSTFTFDERNRRFLSFENKRSLKKKQEFGRKMDLGGTTIWSLEMDDDEDTLLNAVVPNTICG